MGKKSAFGRLRAIFGSAVGLLKEDPRLVLWCLVSLLIGALFSSLPLIPYKLPDSAATILGAAVGAGIAVASASLITQRKDWQHRASMYSALDTAVSEVVERARVCMEIMRQLRGTSVPFHNLQAYKFEYLEAACKEALSDLADLKPAFSHSPADLLLFVAVKKAVEGVQISGTGIQENNKLLAEQKKNADRMAADPDGAQPSTQSFVPFSHSPDELDNRIWGLESAMRRAEDW